MDRKVRINPILKEGREQARQLLESAKILQVVSQNQSKTFNLSDLKADKTQCFESPYPYPKTQSPFEPSEMSARSTMKRKQISNFDEELDELFRTSISANVRDKYRESNIGTRFSSTPRTADMSLRTSFSNTDSQRNSGNLDFWDEAKVSANSFNGSNVSISSDAFQPGEEMSQQLREDEIEQQKEYATIPVAKSNSNETNWENRDMTRQEQMSFGQYCQPFLSENNIRDLYSNTSPRKRQNRVPLVELSHNETPKDSPFGMTSMKLREIVRNMETSQGQDAVYKMLDKPKGPRNVQYNEEDAVTSMVDKMFVNDNHAFDYEEPAERENDDTVMDDASELPVRDKTQINNADSLSRGRNALMPSRGVKRRSSSVTPNETPKTTLDKCLRSKSPNIQREMKAAAASILMPKPLEFKVPQSSHCAMGKSFHKSHNASSMATSSRQVRVDMSSTIRSPSSREYFTANSMSSPTEKHSLPNYGLVRPDINIHSPTSRDNSAHQGLLKRTNSQLSNGSEFHDEILPIKIQKSNRKMSWESVKLYQSSTKSISIQNGSSKKLHMRIKIQGAGFSVTPRDDFRMIPQEARTFEVKFSPSVVGPSRGQLIFEQVTNLKCMKSIPLFAYGGHAAIRIEGVQKGPVGPSFITMGEVKMLNRSMEQYLRLTNSGTLPGFASIVFEKTKWSELNMSESLSLMPNEVRLAPGETTEVKIRFKASKEEIQKILKLNKEVTIVGEICIITGDEATRIRLLNSRNSINPRLIQFLPKNLPSDNEIGRDLVLFNEDIDRNKVMKIIEQIRTFEVALTIGRNLDETQINAELSMADDTSMTFETFCETKINRSLEGDDDKEYDSFFDAGYLESKLFKVTPAQIYFNRRTDKPTEHRTLTIDSTSPTPLYIEAVSSRPDLISALKSCGHIQPGESFEIKVFPQLKALNSRISDPICVTIMFNNAKIDVPVHFVD